MSMRDRIQTALQPLDPQHVEVLDEKPHAQPRAGDPLQVVLVSPQFAGLNAVKRHQKVYATLGGLMGEFHALALHTFTPEEWSQAAVPASPTCRGGSKHDIP
ncbi:BolA/IbaG family iron-sulfur metabolism protein [Pseudomonas aeruginosa]|nr:BolA/IbaG family iron-sulfur metabolism protein [Pseudomonas aeruginosa]